MFESSPIINVTTQLPLLLRLLAGEPGMPPSNAADIAAIPAVPAIEEVKPLGFRGCPEFPCPEDPRPEPRPHR